MEPLQEKASPSINVGVWLNYISIYFKFSPTQRNVPQQKEMTVIDNILR